MGRKVMTISNLLGIYTGFLEDNRLVNKIPKEHLLLKERNSFFGLEVEVECLGILPDVEKAMNNYEEVNVTNLMCYAKEDHSLRNFGIEFVSIPIPLALVPDWLEDLFSFIKKYWPRSKFTSRCSIHVHQDMTNMTFKQLLSLFKLYLVFEKKLFEFAGGDRNNNTFCNPLSEIEFEKWFPKNINKSKPMDFVKTLPEIDVYKYSALNLCRLPDTGTIEYRHLPGTFDTNKILNFIYLIQKIKEYAIHNYETINRDIMDLNTVSNYQQFSSDVFKEDAKILFPLGDYENIATGVTTAKRLLSTEYINLTPSSLKTLLGNSTCLEILRKLLPDSNNQNILAEF